MVASIITDSMLSTSVANTEESKPHNKQLDLVIRTSGRVPAPQTARFSFYNGYDGRNRQKIGYAPLSPTYPSGYSPTYPTFPQSLPQSNGYNASKREPKKIQIAEG